MTHRKHITKRRHTTLFRTFGPLFSECPSVKLCWYERAFHSSTQLHTFLSEYLLPLFTKCSTFHLNGPHLNAPLDKDGKQFHHWPLLLLPAVLRQNRVIVQLHNGAEQGPTMVCAAEIVQWLHHHDAKANAEAVVRRSRRELFLSFESVGPDDQTGDEQSPILEELKARLVQELYAASEKRPYSLDIILLWCYNRTRGALSEQLNQHTGEKLVCALKVWGGEHGHDLLPGAHDCFTSWSFNITRSPIQA